MSSKSCPVIASFSVCSSNPQVCKKINVFGSCAPRTTGPSTIDASILASSPDAKLMAPPISGGGSGIFRNPSSTRPFNPAMG